MFKWFDELNNEITKKEDCDLDVEEWKCVRFKPIGSEKHYESYLFCLPPEEEILHLLSCWYMNNWTEDFNRSDAEEICDIWDILSLKLQGLRMIETLCLFKHLQTLNQEHIDIMLRRVDAYLH